MNKFISFCFLFFVTLPVHAQGLSCNLTGFNFEDLYKTMASECIKETTDNSQCKCIYEEMNQRADTNSKMVNGYDEYFAEMENQKKPYRDQFDQVYKKVTVQVAAQEEVLNMYGLPGARPIGCSPDVMSVGINKKILANTPKVLEELTELKADAVEDLKSCERGGVWKFRKNARGCAFYSNRVDMIERKIKLLATDTSACKIAMDSFKTEFSKTKIYELGKRYTSSGSVNSSDLMGMNIPKWKEFLDGGSPDKLLASYGNNCRLVISAFGRMMRLFDNKNGKNNELDGAEKIPVQCASDDLICEAFAEKNKEMLNNELNQYQAKDDECVTYAEYVTAKGMPSPSVLKEFAEAKHPEDLLNDKVLTDKNKERIRFLQANPLIAMVAKGSKKEELGTALKEMAKTILAQNGKDPSEGFRSYLDFMKGKFGDIYKRNKDSSTMNICNELTRDYSSIQLANDLPPLANEPVEDDNAIAKTKQVIRKCIGRENRNTGTTKLEETLKLSPIYVLGVDAATTEPSAAGFDTFKNAYCKGYEEHRATKCTGMKDMGDCRKSFNTPSPVAEFREAMEARGLQSTITAEGAARMAARTDVTKQDVVKKDWWEKEVGSKLSQNAIMGRNDHGEYAAAVANNEKIATSPDIESRYQEFIKPGSTVPSSNIAATPSTDLSKGGFSRSSDDSDQVRPDFEKNSNVVAPKNNFASLPPETIQNAKEMTAIDPGFNSKPPEEKLSTYKALQDFANERGVVPGFDVNDEIETLEKGIASKEAAIEKIAKDDTKDNEKDKIIKSNNTVNRAPANFSQTSFSAPVSGAPVMGQFPKATLSAGGKINKAEASYQAALLQKHGQSPDLQIMVQGNLADAPFIVPEKNIVKADDVYPFETLSDPVKLSEFLAIKLGAGVKDGESVKILNPNSNEYFVMKATKKDGVTSYQRIPFVKKEEIRIMTLGRLTNEIENATNQK